jgi:hypothetical protein
MKCHRASFSLHYRAGRGEILPKLQILSPFKEPAIPDRVVKTANNKNHKDTA